MTETPKPNETPAQKPQEITVTVDNKQTEILAKQLAEAEQAKKETEAKLAKAEADMKAQEETAKKSAEEAEDLKNKLGFIAEKELDKKRKGVVEKANALLKDPERVKEIESKLSTPEGIAAMEFTMNTLEKQIKVGEEQFKQYQESEKKRLEEAEAKRKADEAAAIEAAKTGKAVPKPETPAGSAPLNPQQQGAGSEPTDLMHKKFASYEAMVRYLHDVENGPDKQQAAEAKAALTSLLQKWASLVKAKYDTMQGGPENGVETKPFKEMMLNKRAQAEIEARKQGQPPQSVV